MTQSAKFSNILLRHKGRVIQFVLNERDDVHDKFMYRESTQDVTFDIRQLPAVFQGDDALAVSEGDKEAHKRTIERAINRNFDLTLKHETLHTCLACDWTGSMHQLELIEDAPHRVAAGELMPLGQCPSCGTCIEVGDDQIPDYTLMECVAALRKQGWVIQAPDERLLKVA